MSYLVDTHALLWYLHDDKLLSQTACDAIETADTVFVSIASLWEIAIKTNLGKLTLAEPFEDFFPKQLQLNEIDILPVQLTHLKKLKHLAPFHKDPFDRLIIAQALEDGLTLISKDTAFKNYNLSLLW